MFDSELFLERLKAYGQPYATYSMVYDGKFAYVERISDDGYWFGSVNNSSYGWTTSLKGNAAVEVYVALASTLKAQVTKMMDESRSIGTGEIADALSLLGVHNTDVSIAAFGMMLVVTAYGDEYEYTVLYNHKVTAWDGKNWQCDSLADCLFAIAKHRGGALARYL